MHVCKTRSINYVALHDIRIIFFPLTCQSVLSNQQSYFSQAKFYLLNL